MSIITLTFKTPDVVSGTLDDFFGNDKARCEEMKIPYDDDIAFEARASVEKGIGQFVKYGEYLTVEYNTATGTMTVKKV